MLEIKALRRTDTATDQLLYRERTPCPPLHKDQAKVAVP